MTINERIKNLRKYELNMNQTEFATLIGMKQTSVSSFEKKGATVTDQTIKSICFAVENLSEDWLRYGTEPMYLRPVYFSLNELAEKKGATELDFAIVKSYFELEPDVREKIINIFKKNILENSIKSDGHPDTPEELERLYPPVDIKNKDVI